MKKKVFGTIILLSTLVFLMTACIGGTDKNKGVNRGQLTNYHMKFSFDQEAINDQLSAMGLYAIAQHGIDFYAIEYETINFHEQKVIASGLIAVPQQSNAPDIISYQHGTLFARENAPSMVDREDLTNYSSEAALSFLFASRNYIFIMPDYLGFGSGTQMIHPYCQEKTMASSVVDMIRAAKYFLKDTLGITISERVELTGFSQGGYATLAAMKAIEGSHYEEFIGQHGFSPESQRTFPMSGPYSISVMKNIAINDQVYGSYAYLAYLIYSNNLDYHFYQDNDEVFKAPYDEIVTDIFNGDCDAHEVFTAFESVTIASDLFTQNFLNALDDPTSEYSAALNENRLDDWIPQTSLKFYHSTGDEVVPIENLTAITEAFAEADHIYEKVYEGLSHTQTFEPALSDLIMQHYLFNCERLEGKDSIYLEGK